MLTDNELSIMRGVVESLMPDTCNLLTATTTRGTDGAPVDTWGTVSAGVACRVDAINGRESVQGAALKDYHAYRLTLPHDTTIDTNYRVEVNSYTYAVTEVNLGNSLATCRRARIERV